jgi:hypothetical protein
MMTENDLSNGYEAIALDFIQRREQSCSLGGTEYQRLFLQNGLELVAEYQD